MRCSHSHRDSGSSANKSSEGILKTDTLANMLKSDLDPETTQDDPKLKIMRKTFTTSGRRIIPNFRPIYTIQQVACEKEVFYVNIFFKQLLCELS